MVRKIAWSLTALFAVFVFTARHEVGVPCDQCDKTTVTRCLLARAVAGFDKGFLHYECVEKWCEEQPIKYDENGHIIPAS